MSVREFAAHLGVTDRMVSKWEADGSRIRPRPVNQAALDESLRRCTADELERFEGWNAADLDERGRATRVRWGLVVDLSPADIPLASVIADEINNLIERHRRPSPAPVLAGQPDSLGTASTLS
jgi:transcriptional regulator with XRE-family HTH domain